MCTSRGDGELSRLVGRMFCFFQAEDGMRDLTVTGVQTCALPIYCGGVATANAFCCAGCNCMFCNTNAFVGLRFVGLAILLNDIFFSLYGVPSDLLTFLDSNTRYYFARFYCLVYFNHI